MESAIWLVIYAAAFVGLVLFGFWVIAKAFKEMPQANKYANVVFGVIVLIGILFAIAYLVNHGGFGAFRTSR